jgi:precorrin-2 dehydrogenase/sirohydrochlorin ferrochelatase
MKYYPICLDLEEKTCLVVGGSRVAWRKAKRLLASKAKIKLVAQKMLPEFKKAVTEKKISYLGPQYKREYLKDIFLVIGATNDNALNAYLSQEAKKANILYNIVDQPERCNFIVPSLVKRGDLIITISTSGKSPALAKTLRQQLEKQFGKEYSIFLELLAGFREHIKHLVPKQRQREVIFNRLVNSDILTYIKEKNWQKVKKEIKRCVPEIADLDKIKAYSALPKKAKERGVKCP